MPGKVGRGCSDALALPPPLPPVAYLASHPACSGAFIRRQNIRNTGQLLHRNHERCPQEQEVPGAPSPVCPLAAYPDLLGRPPASSQDVAVTGWNLFVLERGEQRGSSVSLTALSPCESRVRAVAWPGCSRGTELSSEPSLTCQPSSSPSPFIILPSAVNYKSAATESRRNRLQRRLVCCIWVEKKLWLSVSA